MLVLSVFLLYEHPFIESKRLNKTNIFYSSENKARWDLTARGQFCPRRPAPILPTSNGWGGVIVEEKGWETCDACGLESDRG